MGDRTAIEWAEATWNPVMGCTPVSEGCEHCYARAMMRRYAGRKGWPASPESVELFPERLLKPLGWRPKRVFVCSMGDLFHEDVPFEFITRVFDMMCTWRWLRKAAERSGDESPLGHHTFLVLTKRPERIHPWLTWVRKHWGDSPLTVNLDAWDHCGPHIWLGVSVENQARADERIPLLLDTPAAVRFVSCEPMLGPVDLDLAKFSDERWGAWRRRRVLHWVIAGGETGPGARPMHPDWPRRLRDQCQEAEVPFFFKQWGEWVPESQNAAALSERTARTALYVEPDGRTRPAARGARGQAATVQRVGRRAAGCRLDGHEWREYPKGAGGP